MTDAARVFHEETKNWPDRRRGPRRLEYTPNAPDNLPLTFKEYRGVPTVQLPLGALAKRTRRAVDVLAKRDATRAALDAAALARILAFSAGITRVMERPPGRKRYFRAASSAHSYPDVYVVCGDLGGIEAGVYYFHGLHLRLDRLRAGDFRAALADAAAEESIARRPASVVIVGVPWRAASNYGERALRHVYWDTGGLLANMVAVADADDVESRIALGFADSSVAALVGVDGVQQFAVAIATFGAEAGRASAAPPIPPLAVADPPISAGEPVLFPLVTDAHRSGELADRASVAAWRGARGAAGVASLAGALTSPRGRDQSIEDVILHRGSTRRMRLEALPLEALEWAIAAALRPVPGDWVDDGTTLLEHRVIVHAVEGIAAGLYGVDSAGISLLRAAELREEARFASLGQAQGGDGAYTTFHFADLDRVSGPLGPRGYRAAQVEGGYVLERLHLAAYALGVGATGLTFCDDAASALCETSIAVMTEVAVGRPAYRAKVGQLGEEAVMIKGRAFDLFIERMRELEDERRRSAPS